MFISNLEILNYNLYHNVYVHMCVQEACLLSQSFWKFQEEHILALFSWFLLQGFLLGYNVCV